METHDARKRAGGVIASLRWMGISMGLATAVARGGDEGTRPVWDITITSRYNVQQRLPKSLRDFLRENPQVHLKQWTGIELPGGMQASLAVGVLGSFIAAYNGWEWAIVVCQDPKIWTIAVWTYQFSQTAAAPYTVMAAFVINSIPVLFVFLFCQKVILKGIVLPTMK